MKNLFQKMKQWYLNAKHSRIMARRFRQEWLKVLVSEQKNDDKYNQKDYSSCYERAEHMLNDAVEPLKKIGGYSIACHREVKHHESHREELNTLSNVMPVKDVKIAAKGFWGH